MKKTLGILAVGIFLLVGVSFGLLNNQVQAQNNLPLVNQCYPTSNLIYTEHTQSTPLGVQSVQLPYNEVNNR